MFTQKTRGQYITQRHSGMTHRVSYQHNTSSIGHVPTEGAASKSTLSDTGFNAKHTKYTQYIFKEIYRDQKLCKIFDSENSNIFHSAFHAAFHCKTYILINRECGGIAYAQFIRYAFAAAFDAQPI